MKQYDVVVFGSTGFTGRLVCKHIAQTYHGKGEFTWAMAGRSKAKLEQVRDGLIPDSEQLADVALLEADVSNQASLDAMAASAAVIITTVGPYARYGRPVVKACVENKAHCCDLTGEAQYIRKTIDEFDAAAKANGVKIVHTCGFDSIPAEAVTLMAAHHMFTAHGMQLGETTTVMAMKADPSGGTLESVVQLFQEAGSDPEVRKILSHPYAFTPQYNDEAALKELTDKPSPPRPMWSNATQSWTGPCLMAMTDEKIVRMSNALLGWKYGKHMKYAEREGRGFLKSLLNTIKLSLIGAVFMFVAKFPWLRKKLPMPGEGPTEEFMNNAWFKTQCWALPHQPEAINSNGNGAEAVRVHSMISDMHRDPGYWSTARMLLECALCMIPKNDKLLAQDPYASLCPAGVLAPSAAFGLVLHDRLRNAGYDLSVGDVLKHDKNQ